MKTLQIIILIYAFSWLVLFGVYIGSRFSKNYRRSKSPWYIYLIMFVGAPICVLVIPFLACSMIKEKKQERISNDEYESKMKEEDERKEQAKHDYLKTAIGGTNEGFVELAQVANKLREVIESEGYNQIQIVLDKVSIPNGQYLGVQKYLEDGLGDVSLLYIGSPLGAKNYSLYDIIVFDNSTQGAWQAYLLHQINHYLPLWWHANYGRRDYIYSVDDLSKILHFTEDYPALPDISDQDLSPMVIKSVDKYYITSCYWSEFRGLVREYAQLDLSNGKLSDFLVFDEDVLFEYNCGIKF